MCFSIEGLLTAVFNACIEAQKVVISFNTFILPYMRVTFHWMSMSPCLKLKF